MLPITGVDTIDDIFVERCMVCDQCQARVTIVFVCCKCHAYHCDACHDSDTLCRRCAPVAERVMPKTTAMDERPYYMDRRLGRDVAERNFERGY